MADVSRLEALEKVLGTLLLPDRTRLDETREALRTAPSGASMPVLVTAYRDALTAALGGEALARQRLNDLTTGPLTEFVALKELVADRAARARSLGRELDAQLSVGPVDLLLGAQAAAVPGAPVIAHLPVSSLGMSIDAGPLKASGAGFLRPPEAGALISGEFGAAALTLAGLIESGTSLGLFAALRAEFRPTGLQVGLGFSIDAIGGFLGINRTIDVDALRRRLVDGSAASALFGGSTTVAGLASTLDALSAIFRRADGHSVVGPAFSVGWLNVNGWSLVRLDVAVILSLPDARMLLPGRAVLEVPGPGSPVVHLRADMLGVIDVVGRRVSVDAVLVDSQVLGIFRLGGTAAGFLSWGSEPSAVLTVGGFFPGFDPAPAVVPPQQRVAMSLSPPLPGARVNVTGYAAAAVGTLQFGGSLSVGYDFGIAAITGTVSGDALFQLSPTHFEVRVAGGVSISALGVEKGVDCHGTLTGPGPTVLSVYAGVKIFGKRFGGWKDFLLEGGRRDTARADTLKHVVQHELQNLSNYAALGDADPMVTLRKPPTKPNQTVLAPTGQLVWRQDRFPIGVAVEKADGRVLGAPATVTFAPLPSGISFREPLATAMFLDLSVDEILAQRPYQSLHVGYTIPVSRTESTTVKTASSDFFNIELPTQAPLSGVTPLARAVGYSLAVARASGPPTLIAPIGPVATALSPPIWQTFAAGEDPAGETMSAGDALAKAHSKPHTVAMPRAAAVEIGI